MPGPIPNCAARTECSFFGHCSWDGERCAALNDADCPTNFATGHAVQLSLVDGHCRKPASSASACTAMPDEIHGNVCQINGACAVVGGHCAATTRAHCAASIHCKQRGMCTLAGDGTCVVSSDADCRQTDWCVVYGLQCTARAGKCVTPDDAACRRASVCEQSGRCFLDGERCVARNAADCRASVACRTAGACDLIDDGCGPTTDRHCLDSVHCARLGNCRPEQGRCVE